MIKNGQIFKSFNPHVKDENMDRGGVVCQLSWSYLKPHLEKVCDLKENEELVGIVIDEAGIRFKIETK